MKKNYAGSAIASNPITNTAKYDITGNVTIDQKFRGLRYYYDANGRMWRSANVDDTAPSTSVYDGLGQRVQTIDSNNTKTLVYDAFGRLVSEYDTGLIRTFTDENNQTSTIHYWGRPAVRLIRSTLIPHLW